MLIRDQLRKQGERLFRWRNTAPVILIPLALLALPQSRWIEARYGQGVDDTFEWLCLGVSLLGVGLRFAIAGCLPRRSSGRNTHKGQVADVLNTTGIYSLVRHPLYLANFAIFVGFLLTSGSLWPVAVGCLLFWLYYERIAFAEEAFLLHQFGERYVAWAQATPALVPRLRMWHPPALPFCWRSALKREYRTVCATLLAFAVLDVVEDAVTHGRFGLEAENLALLACAAIVFLAVRFVHKRTRLLHAPGR